jgi:hypothetical protein
VAEVDACIDERFDEFSLRLGHKLQIFDSRSRIPDWAALQGAMPFNPKSKIPNPKSFRSARAKAGGQEADRRRGA